MDRNLLLNLANRFGTPVFVYDGDAIIKKYKAFVSAFKVKSLKVHFALKSLNNLAVLNLLRQQGCGLDCVSWEEVQLGLEAGFEPSEMMFTPNGVDYSEYKKVIQTGAKITVDNISILEKIAHDTPALPVFIRINPHLMAGGHSHISVGHIDSKFGISIHQLPIIQRLVRKYKLNIEGIHVHTGSDIIDPEVFQRVASLVFSIADQFEGIRSIDLGSGFKVKYKEKDLYTDIAKVGAAFSKEFNLYCKTRKRDLTLRFEPGKYMVSDAGCFLAKVNVIKQTTSCTFVAVDTGFNHLIRPMFYQAYHEIKNISNPSGTKKMYSVVGYICETDTFAEDRVLNEVREHDILSFQNAGAYCYTMSSNYNSRLRPPEVLVVNGRDYLVRTREPFEALLAGQFVPSFLKKKNQ